MAEETKFKVNFKDVGEVKCMLLSGFLDAHTAPILENAIQNVMSENNYKILMNFSELDYISSAGLGVFMSFIEDIRNNGGDIKMTAMSDKIFSVFDLLGFTMLFDIDNNEDLILGKFNNNEIKN